MTNIELKLHHLRGAVLCRFLTPMCRFVPFFNVYFLCTRRAKSDTFELKNGELMRFWVEIEKRDGTEGGS